MIGFVQEFKTFAFMDLAVGVIIGGAFSKVVTSLVDNIIMPPIGFLIGGVDFSNLALKLQAPELMGLKVEPVLWKYGAFVQSLFDFTVIALAIFTVVKAMNHLKKKEETSVPETVPPVISRDTELLEAILETLKSKS